MPSIDWVDALFITFCTFVGGAYQFVSDKNPAGFSLLIRLFRQFASLFLVTLVSILLLSNLTPGHTLYVGIAGFVLGIGSEHLTTLIANLLTSSNDLFTFIARCKKAWNAFWDSSNP